MVEVDSQICNPSSTTNVAFSFSSPSCTIQQETRVCECAANYKKHMQASLGGRDLYRNIGQPYTTPQDRRYRISNKKCWIFFLGVGISG